MNPAAETTPDEGPGSGRSGAGPGIENKAESIECTISIAGKASIDRKMLDDIFGDVLPDTTADERGAGDSGSYSEEWYRENRPPHHGG